MIGTVGEPATKSVTASGTSGRWAGLDCRFAERGQRIRPDDPRDAGRRRNCLDDPAILPATGYLGRNWYKFDRNVWLFDTVEKTSEALLGLTMRCGRCHDHKYDPITQQDYYRFRAFFEPHDVRIDPVSASVPTETDNNKSKVLADGIPRIFDKELDAKTFVFRRGDGRYPDEENPLTPAVPAIFGGDPVTIEPVQLPPGAYYPALRPEVRQTFLEQADQQIVELTKQLADAKAAVETATATVEKARLAAAEKANADNTATSDFLHDDFSKAQPDVWKTVNGDWAYEGGHLTEKAVTSFATIVTQQNHPANFQAKLRYVPLQPGTYRSIGFSFDYQDQGNSQDVYTSTGDARQSVQAFHRTGGKQVYPQAGIVSTELKVGEPAELFVTVRGTQLSIDLNGERKLDYVLPIKRQPGKFALWVHNGSWLSSSAADQRADGIARRPGAETPQRSKRGHAGRTETEDESRTRRRRSLASPPTSLSTSGLTKPSSTTPQ